MSLCGAVAGFVVGLRPGVPVGYHALADLAAIAAGVLLVAAYVANRRTPVTPALVPGGR